MVKTEPVYQSKLSEVILMQ